MSEKIKAWHFVGDKLRDGRTVPRVGAVLRQDGKIIPCENGLHGSVRIMDALQYAPSNTKWICRTEHRGAIVEHGNDKIASSERVILWKVNADPILRKFARMCALDVIHLCDAPDIVKKYLKTGDEKIRAAARDSARAAAWDSAWAAARDSARAAAWDSAWAAARDSARGSARGSARDSARDSARAAARAAAWAAARAAAWAAAMAAAWAAQNTRLTSMIHAARKK